MPKDANLTGVKFISLDPSKHSMEPLAKCFNYRGNLPQVVIDKIVDSYNHDYAKFSNVNVSLNDFYAGYDSNPIVSQNELCDTFAELGKKY